MGNRFKLANPVNRFEQEGLNLNTTFAMGRDLRAQAMRDFPVLRKVARLLRTPEGRHMARWDTLALAVELLLMGHTVATVARSCEMCRKKISYLRERMIDGGVLSAKCGCGRDRDHCGRCWFRKGLPARPRYCYSERRREMRRLREDSRRASIR